MSDRGRMVLFIILLLVLSLILVGVGLYMMSSVARANSVPAGWQQTTTPGLRIIHVRADAGRARNLADGGRSQLQKIAALLGLPEQLEVTVYLHPSITELQNTVGAKDLVAGVDEQGVIHIASVPKTHDQLNTLLLQQFARVGLERKLGEQAHTVPVWLADGLAVWAGDRDVGQEQRIMANQEGNPLGRSDQGASPFASPLAAGSFLRYLERSYKPDRVASFLVNLKDGQSFDTAFVAHFGKSPADLRQQWRFWLKRTYGGPKLPVLAFGLVGFTLFVFATLSATRSPRRNSLSKSASL